MGVVTVGTAIRIVGAIGISGNMRGSTESDCMSLDDIVVELSGASVAH